MLQINVSKRAAVIIAVAVVLVIPGVAGATHIFTDVTDGSVHAPGIEWVANAGVTQGCGDGTAYCPNDDVNRAQMATFMHRLSGNAAGIAPSVNADQLDSLDSTDFLGATDQAVDSDQVDGKDLDEFAPLLWASTDLTSGGTTVTSALIEVNSVSVDLPTDGLLMISGSVFINNGAGATTYELVAKVDGADAAPNSGEAVFNAAANGVGVAELFTLAYTLTVEASAGAHTVTQDIDPSGTPNFFFNRPYLSVLFIPEGSGDLVSLGSIGTPLGSMNGD